MPSGAAQLPRQRGGTCRHRGAVIGCRAPQTLQPERGLGRPAGGRRRRGRRGCPDAGHAVRRSLRRADIRPPGRADVQCPGVRCPRDRCDPGVRTDRCPDRQASGVRGRCVRAVRTALHPGRRCRGTGHVGGPGSTCRCGPRAGWSSLPGCGLAGKRWSCVGSAWLARVSTAPGPPLRSRRLRRRARRLADQGSGSSARVPVGGWGAREGAGAHESPAGTSWAGCRRAARPWG